MIQWEENNLAYLASEDFIGNNEMDDPYHYGMSLINLIRKENHEISTLTFCH